MNAIASPKGISKKKPQTTTTNTSTESLAHVRRRLSVMSDNTLVEGMSKQVLDSPTEAAAVGSSSTSLGSSTSPQSLIITDFAGVSKKGYAPYNPRKKNQDALIMESHAPTNSVLLAVFDGHGEAGDAVSTYFKKHFASNLFGHAAFQPTGSSAEDSAQIQVAISQVLSACEQKLLKNASIDTEFSGTTAVVSVTRGTTIVVGNVGDSRIIRGVVGAPPGGSPSRKGNPGGSPANPRSWLAAEISNDHKPDRPDERARILAKGGRVFAVEYDDGIDGPPRVWLGHMDVPGLAMSRSLGDTVAHSAGVISTPEFFVQQLVPGEDQCLVLATDGLWEFMTNEDVLHMIVKSKSKKHALAETVDVLIAEASKRWMKEEQVIDDTTVILATLR